jgi:hypothetical protein
MAATTSWTTSPFPMPDAAPVPVHPTANLEKQATTLSKISRK